MDKNETIVKLIDVVTMESSDIKLELGENVNLQNMVLFDEGYLLLVEEYNKRGDNTYDYDFSYRIEMYNLGFEKQKEIDITDIAKSTNDVRFTADDILVDKDCNIYVAKNSTIWVINNNSDNLTSIQLGKGDSVKNMVKTENGKLLAVYEDYNQGNNHNSIGYFDMNEPHNGELFNEFPEMNMYPKIYASKGDKLYVGSTAKLYEYDIFRQESEELLIWTDCYMTTEKIKDALVLENDTLVFFSETTDYSSENQKVTFEFAKLSKVPASSVAAKEEITLGMLTPDYEIQERVAHFNKYNSEYKISIKTYVAEDFSNYSAAMTEFDIDVATGDMADIIIFSGDTDISTYVLKGALVNLNEFLEKDTEIRKEDFISNILDTIMIDGKLCAVADSFDVNTLVGRTVDVGKGSTWSIEVFKNLVKANQGAEPVYNFSRVDGMDLFLKNCIDLFYDDVKCEYNFKCQEFYDLLEIIAAFPESIKITEKSLPAMLRNREVLLCSISLGDFSSIQLYEELYGEDINIIGYPVKNGSGSIVRFSRLMAINAKSENKEVAWQFIRSFLTEEGQRSISGNMPLDKKLYENMIEEAMKPLGEGDKMSYVFGNIEFKIGELSSENADKMREEVYGINSRYIHNSNIYSIILEESGAYFAGDKSAQEVADIIQNRVNMYIEERR